MKNFIFTMFIPALIASPLVFARDSITFKDGVIINSKTGEKVALVCEDINCQYSSFVHLTANNVLIRQINSHSFTKEFLIESINDDLRAAKEHAPKQYTAVSAWTDHVRYQEEHQYPGPLAEYIASVVVYPATAIYDTVRAPFKILFNSSEYKAEKRPLKKVKKAFRRGKDIKVSPEQFAKIIEVVEDL